MAKKGNKMLIGFSLAGVFVLVALIGLGVMFKGTIQSTIQPTETQATTGSTFCANNPSVDARIRLRDALNPNEVYEANTVLFVDKSEDTQIITSNNTGGTSTFDTNVNALVCGHAYDIYARSTVDDDNGGFLKSLTSADTQVDPVTIDETQTNVSLLRARINDNDENAFMYDSVDNSANDYENLNASGINFTSTTSNTSLKAVGTDECLDLRIDIKTRLADSQFGLKTLMALDIADDSNSDDWDSESVEISFEGKTLTEMRGNLDSNDQLAITGYEQVYDLGRAIDDQARSIDFAMCSGAGVNPDFVPKIWFIGTGLYTDDKNPNVIIGGEDGVVAFRTDSSRTAIITATNQKMLVSIT